MLTLSWEDLPPLSELQAHTVLLRACDNQADIDRSRPAGFLLELERSDNEIFIDIRIDECHIRALIDPNSDKTYIDAIFAADYPAIFSLSHGRGAMTNCRVAGLDFPTVPVIAADLSEYDNTWPPAMILGKDFLSHGNFFFDFPNNAWLISKVHP